jgi:drug/metabolite transporter (DMT)-like permease
MKTGCWMFACKTLLVLPVAIATAPTGGFFPAAEVILSDVRAVALLGTLAVCCTAFNYMVIVVWQRYVTAVEAGIIYCAEPVYAALLALFLPGLISGLTGISYPNESIGWQLAVGGGLVTVANVWMGLYGERKNS